MIVKAGGSATSGVLDLVDGAATTVRRSTAWRRNMDGSTAWSAHPAINVRKPILKCSLEEFDKVVHLNLRGNFAALSGGRPHHDRRSQAA